MTFSPTLKTLTVSAAAWLALTACQTTGSNSKQKAEQEAKHKTHEHTQKAKQQAEQKADETIEATKTTAKSKLEALPPAGKELSFIDFCKNPKLSGSEKLMKYLHPDPKESCEAAKERLLKVTNINLKRLEIKDLRAISVFKNAKLMSLSFNPIADLSPLRGFDQLQVLFLRHIALGDTVAKSEANCPTDDGVFKSIREFCLKR